MSVSTHIEGSEIVFSFNLKDENQADIDPSDLTLRIRNLFTGASQVEEYNPGNINKIDVGDFEFRTTSIDPGFYRYEWQTSSEKAARKNGYFRVRQQEPVT